MDQDFREKLLSVSIDADHTIDRFMGNEELYKKFLGKFLKDVSYQELMEGYEQHDASKAFRAAHTLKGVSANLGLISIMDCVTPMVTAMRGGEFPEDMEEALLQLGVCYQKVCSLIRTL